MRLMRRRVLAAGGHGEWGGDEGGAGRADRELVIVRGRDLGIISETLPLRMESGALGEMSEPSIIRR